MRKIGVVLIILCAWMSCGNDETLDVSNRTVYELFSFNEHVKCKKNFNISWYGDNEKETVIGSVSGGKISFTLPENVEREFFSDPENINGYDVSPGLEIAILDGNFRLLKETRNADNYKNHDEMAFVYSNIDGSFKINDVTLNLKQGWNLFNNKFERIKDIRSLYRKGYQFYAFENINLDYEIEYE